MRLCPPSCRSRLGLGPGGAWRRPRKRLALPQAAWPSGFTGREWSAMAKRLYSYEELEAMVARALGQERLTDVQRETLSKQGFSPDFEWFDLEEVGQAVAVMVKMRRRFTEEDVREAVALLRHRDYWEGLWERERKRAQALESWELVRQVRLSLFAQEGAPVQGEPGPRLTEAVRQFLEGWAERPCPALVEAPLTRGFLMWSLTLPSGTAIGGFAKAIPGAPDGLRGYLVVRGRRIPVRAGSCGWALKLAATYLEEVRTGVPVGRMAWFLLTGHLDLAPLALYPPGQDSPHVLLDAPVSPPGEVAAVMMRRARRLWPLYQAVRLSYEASTWAEMFQLWQERGLQEWRPFPTEDALRKWCVRHDIRPQNGRP